MRGPIPLKAAILLPILNIILVFITNDTNSFENIITRKIIMGREEPASSGAEPPVAQIENLTSVKAKLQYDYNSLLNVLYYSQEAP